MILNTRDAIYAFAFFGYLVYVWTRDILPRMCPELYLELLDPLIIRLEEQTQSLLLNEIKWIDPKAGTEHEVLDARVKLISESQEDLQALKDASWLCMRMVGAPWIYIAFCKWYPIMKLERKARDRYYRIETQLEHWRGVITEEEARDRLNAWHEPSTSGKREGRRREVIE
ncbi:hypothetical protein C8R45DRAFT_638386 [Mycena sanguinolenta]|nr:hypothetical protein C8R45DRAFT_638386 [Mycena sanguinolenta]